MKIEIFENIQVPNPDIKVVAHPTNAVIITFHSILFLVYYYKFLFFNYTINGGEKQREKIHLIILTFEKCGCIIHLTVTTNVLQI